MRPFRDIPIRQKLMIIVMLTTATALLITGMGIVAFDSYFFRRSLQRDLSSLAQMIADNTTAALAFNDPQTATETLAALRARTWPRPVFTGPTQPCSPRIHGLTGVPDVRRRVRKSRLMPAAAA